MKSLDRPLIALILLASALGISSGSSAAADRNVIRIRGRVVDRAGNGLSGAWVVTLGSRRTGTIVGGDGSYSLSVPGATLAEIQHVPLKLRVQARRKDWRIGLPGGDSELGIELRVASDSSGSWLQVRSNDATVAQMLANAAVLESGTRVELTVDFVGVRGAPVTEEVPLARLEEVRLSGVSMAVSETTARVPAKRVASAAEPVRTKTTPTPPPATASRPAPAESTARPAPVEAAASPPHVEAAARPAVTPSSSEAPPQASPAQAESKPQVEDSIARGKKVARPRVVRPALTSDDVLSETDDGPRVVRPGAPEETARREAERAKRKPRARAATADEVRRLIEVKPELASEIPPEVPNSGSGGKPGPTARQVSAPDASPSFPSTAPVTSVGPVAPPAGGSSDLGVGPCNCRIVGSIEINSDRPLPERMQVVVSLEDEGKIKDTVELFMGSPREFELLGVSCKPHRIRFKTKSKQKFMLVSDEPIVDCSGGGFRQIKLVLEPINRWRVSK